MPAMDKRDDFTDPGLIMDETGIPLGRVQLPQVTILVVCPHCDERFDIGTRASLAAVRQHVQDHDST